jgi:hypothetical protein
MYQSAERLPRVSTLAGNSANYGDILRTHYYGIPVRSEYNNNRYGSQTSLPRLSSQSYSSRPRADSYDATRAYKFNMAMNAQVYPY